MAADDDIFQQYRNAPQDTPAPAASTAAPPASAPPAPAASTTAKPPGGDDVFQQYRNAPADTTAPPPLTTTAQTQQSQTPPDTIAPGLRAYLSPAPNTTYGSVLPLARDDATGNLRLAMPSSLRDLAIGGLDLAEGPMTGTVTPAATNALAAAAMAGKLTPSVAAGTGADIAAAAVPKPAPFVSDVNPLDPAAAAAAKANAGPTSSVPPTPPQNLPRVIDSSDDAKAIANAWYKIAESKGADTSLTAQAANKMIDAAGAVGQQTEAGQAVAGTNALTDLQARLQTLRDKPLTLQSVQDMDEAMGTLIDKEYGVTGLSKVGQRLQDIQQSWRSQVSNLQPGDVTGGQQGFDALQPARQAWSQAMKMQDVERMQARAQGTQNPTSSFKTQVNNFVNSAKSRGWSDDEIAALKDAADRGAIGGTLHVLGSRLIPHVAGAVGASIGAAIGGPVGAGVGFGAGEVGSHILGGGARAGANALQDMRINQAYRILGGGTPAPPPGSGYARMPPSAWPGNALGGAVVPLAPGATGQGNALTLPRDQWPGA